jgi:transposase
MFRKGVITQRVKAIKSAQSLTTDDAVITPFRLQCLALADQLALTLQSLRMYDEEIAALAPQHPDYELFRALPGAGPHLAPRLLVAFGEQRERFASAAEVQQYAGIAPVTERSGQKS